MQKFDRENLPLEKEFSLYRKKTFTKAVRIQGPFTTMTREGEITCPNGCLAIDSKGWPYPIAMDEFEIIYEIYSKQMA